MTKIEELDNVFQLFQQSGLNCGGIWKAMEIEKEEINPSDCIKKEIAKIEVYKDRDAYKNYFNPPFDNFGLELIELADWKNYFEKRIDYWSNFEPIWEEQQKAEFIQEEYDKSKTIFKSTLKKYLNQNKLKTVLKIDENKFNNYRTNWGDQISEDFVFVLSHKLLILHFGWSS